MVNWTYVSLGVGIGLGVIGLGVLFGVRDISPGVRTFMYVLVVISMVLLIAATILALYRPCPGVCTNPERAFSTVQQVLRSGGKADEQQIRRLEAIYNDARTSVEGPLNVSV